METNKVYVLVENSSLDGDTSCSRVGGVYATFEKAKEAFFEDISDDLIQRYKELWEYEGCDDEWTMPNDSNLYFEIWNDGYYSNDHINIYVEEFEIK